MGFEYQGSFFSFEVLVVSLATGGGGVIPGGSDWFELVL